MGEVRFDGRVAIVTGAGGGLGREYALLLARRGARVVVNDLGGAPDGGGGANPERAQAVADEIAAAGGEALAEVSSVATPEGGRAIVERALATWGRVDVLIHNAGIAGGRTFPDDSEPEFDRVVRVHLHGAVHVARPAWRAMRERGYGRILLISSGSVFGVGAGVAYPAAKAGLIGLARNLALVGARWDIKVNALMPVAYTRLTALIPDATFRSFLQRRFDPALVAPVAAWLVHRDVPCSGEVFTAGGGRLARVVLGVGPGYQSEKLTLEQVRDHFTEALRSAPLELPSDSMQEVALYGWTDPTPPRMGTD
jgi:NAD(P)-dependent dehydrogenase (short-subunit alcohol dehydrogenase family)